MSSGEVGAMTKETYPRMSVKCNEEIISPAHDVEMGLILSRSRANLMGSSGLLGAEIVMRQLGVGSPPRRLSI